MNYELLNSVIEQSGLKREYIASQIGVSGKVFHDRTSGKSFWKVPEVVRFCKLMGLNKRMRDDIFFADK